MDLEFDNKKLQDLAILVDKILRVELDKSRIKFKMAEARIYNLRTVGVQGDQRTYVYPAEISLIEPVHEDGRKYTSEELYPFLNKLSSRITNEIEGINRVVYVLSE